MRSLELAVVLLFGFILDAVLGDPEWIPHPVVLMGQCISFLEEKLRSMFPDTKQGARAAGSILSLVIPLMFGVGAWLVILVCSKINIYVKLTVEVIFCWLILSARTLANEAKGVYKEVSEGNLEGARSRVSRIVGRDTDRLSLTEVIKACIETVSESTSDGIVAPMLFILVGGVPWGFVYKAINTLDSMVGYKNDRYMYFGSASARLDDIANLIPARVTALIMIVSAYICKYDGGKAFEIWRRDRHKHLSPNSGNPEAACAGALNIQLGGDAYYFGKKYLKETLGDPVREPEAVDIERAIKLMYVTSIICLLVSVTIRLVIYLLSAN